MMLERTDRVNFSSLKLFAKSAKAYRYALTHPRTDTDAFKLGRLVHSMVFEPETVAELYVVMPKFHGGMNDSTATAKGFDGGKQAKAAWLEENQSAETVDGDTFAQASGMSAAIRIDPIAAPLFTGGQAETNIEWIDNETDIECRGRVDYHGSRLVDLKTTRNIEPRLFRRDIVNHLVYMQLAYYSDGLEANGITFDMPPCIVAVENTAPHDVLVLELTAQELDAGRTKYGEFLDRLLICRDTDQWPGVAGGTILPVQLPEWAMPNQEITMGGVPLTA